jgi:predicted negative regulator of RcsB-dependent stress response
VCYFLRLFLLSGKEGNVGTTKLTRKEILHDDPVHNAMIWLIDFFRVNGTKIAAGAVAVVILGFAIWFGIQYLDKREMQAQERCGKGLDFFHASIAADATDDPYSKGLSPTFRSESEKYQAAAKEFSPVASGYGYGALSVVARYYLGLSQLQLGQKKEAIQSFELVAGNSKNRTLGYLAKRMLATNELESGNYKRAQQILESMIKDPRCDLQKDELSLQLSRILIAEGKRDEAIKALQKADSQGLELGSMFKQQLAVELERLQKDSQAKVEPKPEQ